MIRLVQVALAVLLLLARPGVGQEVLVDIADEGGPTEADNFFMPFAFSSETYDLGLGLFASTTGRFQDQLSLYGSIVGSSNGSGTLLLGAADFRIPGTRRLFANAYLSLGSYTNLPAYVSDPTAMGAGNAGSNDSDPDNLLRGAATEGWIELPFTYLLPIGDGEHWSHTYLLDRGLLVEGSTHQGVWDPLESGRTSLGTELFWRRQEFDLANEPEQLSTNGLAFSLLYDNTDFAPNPAVGSRQEIRLQRDFGWFNTAASWTTIEFNASKYVSFDPTSRQRQRTLAFDFWTIDTPTWEETAGGPTHRPPYFEGATLGGWRRLRAYPSYRFNDKSAILYSMEYRVIPDWHPLGNISELRFLDLDWWQWVAFAEVGRVSDSWNVEELHRDMKWDVGLSFRFMAHRQIVRLDIAVGPESSAILFNIGQPF